MYVAAALRGLCCFPVLLVVNCRPCHKLCSAVPCCSELSVSSCSDRTSCMCACTSPLTLGLCAVHAHHHMRAHAACTYLCQLLQHCPNSCCRRHDDDDDDERTIDDGCPHSAGILVRRTRQPAGCGLLFPRYCSSRWFLKPVPVLVQITASDALVETSGTCVARLRHCRHHAATTLPGSTPDSPPSRRQHCNLSLVPCVLSLAAATTRAPPPPHHLSPQRRHTTASAAAAAPPAPRQTHVMSAGTVRP